MSPPADPATGVIHDIGFRHYEGRRLGRTQAVGVLYAHSLRGVFGLSRSARYKVVPLLLFALTCVPALISAAVTVVTPVPPLPYAHYPFYLQLPIVVFLAAQAAQLVTGDVRFKVLPLYFSRPLERIDYVGAKVAALATGLLILIGTPLLLLFVAAILGHTHSASGAVLETGRFLIGLGGAVAHAVILAPLGLAAACLTRVRAFAVVSVIGVYLVTNSVLGIMAATSKNPAVVQSFELVTPFQLLDGFQAWAFGIQSVQGAAHRSGPLYGVATAAWLAASLSLLAWRYGRLRA